MKTSGIVNIVITTLLITTISGCSSLLKIEDESQRSKQVDYEAPEGGFERLSKTYADKAWKHEADGSTISFLSDCNRENEPTIVGIQQGVIRSVNDKKYTSNKWITYNDRRALRSRIKGNVDGVETEIDLTVFKKNGCIYSLTYISVPSNFQKHIQIYESFLSEFEAQ